MRIDHKITVDRTELAVTLTAASAFATVSGALITGMLYEFRSWDPRYIKAKNFTKAALAITATLALIDYALEKSVESNEENYSLNKAQAEKLSSQLSDLQDYSKMLNLKVTVFLKKEIDSRK
jgi:hypothetical protein